MKCAAEANEERQMWSTHCDSSRKRERGGRGKEEEEERVGEGERVRETEESLVNRHQ